MYILQYIFFWLLVLGALGANVSRTEQRKTVIGKETSKLMLGVTDSRVQVACAILAYTFRPW